MSNTKIIWKGNYLGGSLEVGVDISKFIYFRHTAPDTVVEGGFYLHQLPEGKSDVEFVLELLNTALINDALKVRSDENPTLN